jgi:hypothetical protein
VSPDGDAFPPRGRAPAVSGASSSAAGSTTSCLSLTRPIPASRKSKFLTSEASPLAAGGSDLVKAGLAIGFGDPPFGCRPAVSSPVARQGRAILRQSVMHFRTPSGCAERFRSMVWATRQSFQNQHVQRAWQELRGFDFIPIGLLSIDRRWIVVM